MNIGRVRNGAILISAGVVLLMNTTGGLSWSVWPRIFSLWPVALIAVGIELLLKKTRLAFVTLLSPLLFFAAILGPAFLWESDLGEIYRASRSYHWSAEPDSTVTKASATVRLHAGNLEISSGTDELISADLDYSEKKPLVISETSDLDSTATVKITDRERRWLKWDWNRGRFWEAWEKKRWEIKLTDLVPLHLNVYLKASEADMDLSQLMIEDFDLEAKTSQADIRIGNLVDDVTARISSRESKISIYYPEGMGLRIVNRTKFSFSNSSWLILQKTEEGLQTPDFDGTERKLTLYLEGSITKLKINKYKPFEGI
jgi:hypothetical protein